MSIYSNVTEQDLINLRKLAEQQKNQRTGKIKNRFLKQTHDIKLAESLSPVTKKLDEVNKSTQQSLSPITEKLDTINESIKESQPQTPQPAVENTNTSLPIEIEKIQPGVIYDTSLENTLSDMKNNSGFFKIEETNDGEIFWNGFPVGKMGGSKPKINEKTYNITPGIQKVLTDTSNIPIKQLNGQDRGLFINILENLNFESYKAIRDESKSGRYKQSKTTFKKRILEGQGLKLIITSNTIDIYTRLEILLGLKLNGHTDTLTEASTLIDELYKRGEIQNKQQYRNALDKFSNI